MSARVHLASVVLTGKSPDFRHRTLVTKAGGSHLSCQMSKMPETSAVRHFVTIVAYVMRGARVSPILRKRGLAFGQFTERAC